MKERIMELLKIKKQTLHNICVALKANNKTEAGFVKKTLMELEDEGSIIHVGNFYGLKESFETYEGILDLKDSGYGFLMVEGKKDDIFIPANNIGDARDGDKLLVAVDMTYVKGHMKQEGIIVKILERKVSKIVGTFDGKRIIPDDHKISEEVRVNKGQEGGAVVGSKVVAYVTSYHYDYVTAKIEKVIGHKDDPHVDILSLCEAYDIPYVFPNSVMDEIKEIPDHVLDSELEGRTDYRNLFSVTIDGDDAKDLDDGISLELVDGKYVLYVHIMDVSHYVCENTPLDKEAYYRGTSVYLADTVIPMLPHYLSNGICSLNGNVDRLTLTCKMTIDKKGFVLASEINQSVVHSNHRMTYKNANKILNGQKADIEETLYDATYDDVKEFIFNARDLAKILHNRRCINGSIEFETAEPKIVCDDSGYPLEIKAYDRGIAESIIEEFMLIANQTVAKTIKEKNLPFLYRIHEAPDITKLEQMMKVSRGLGISPHKKSELITQFDLQKMIKTVPEEKRFVVNTILLRSMMKARYSREPLGHYGLAFEDYTHFTSPIRRYPDLIVHRLLRKYLFDFDFNKSYYNVLEEIADWTSKTERRSVDCERDVDKMKSSEYMEGHIGEEFTGLISGVQPYGIYVMLDNTIEGMVSIHSLPGRYIFNEELMQLVGVYNKKIFKIGDKVNVVCVKASKSLMQIDFELKGE